MPAVGSRAGHLHWLVDLASHFVLHAAIGSVLLALAAAFLCRPRFAMVALALAAVNAALLAPAYAPGAQAEPAGTRVRLLAANLLYRNRDYAAFERLLRATRPDFLVLLELQDHFGQQLADELAGFAHRIENPATDAFGIALYSRAAELEPVAIENRGPAWIVANTRVGETPLTIAALHTVPPLGQGATQMRDAQLRALAEQRDQLAQRLVITGDLNTGPWSPIFRELLARAGLRDSRAGFGVQGTWPAPLVPLRIPIDHVLVSPGIRVAHREVGPEIGSDHLPVIVDLVVSP